LSTIATSATQVDHFGARGQFNWCHQISHNLSGRSDFFRRLALDPQAHQQSGDLRCGQAAAQQRLKG
jgi:hypothetical protein